MEKAKIELLMNVCLLSFVLSVLYSVLVTNINNSLVSNTTYVSDPGGFVVFVLFFLILYIFHVLISFLNFAVTKIAGRTLSKRLVVFNAIGLMLVGAICFIIKDATVLCLLFSLVVFSAVAAVNNRKMTPR